MNDTDKLALYIEALQQRSEYYANRVAAIDAGISKEDRNTYFSKQAAMDEALLLYQQKVDAVVNGKPMPVDPSTAVVTDEAGILEPKVEEGIKV